jgi:hypothetical protein
LCVGSASARTALCTHTCTPSAEQSALSPHMHRIALPDATGSARTGTWETARGGGAEGGAVALALRRAGSVFARSIQAADLKEKEPMEEAREISPKLVEAAGARRWTSGPGGAGRQTGYSRCQSARRVRRAHADRAFLRDRQGQVPT